MPSNNHRVYKISYIAGELALQLGRFLTKKTYYGHHVGFGCEKKSTNASTAIKGHTRWFKYDRDKL